MQRFIDRLEPRRLFSGGIDSTYGTSGAATFTLPANAQVLDSTVDPSNRTILVGTVPIGSGKSATHQMFIARLENNGQPDMAFNSGLVQGTPRGITQLDRVIALADGGYIAVQQNGADPTIASEVVRFTPSLHLDHSFGINGVRRVTIDVQQILERSDHSLILVGYDISRVNDVAADATYVNYATHINADGSMDPTFGDNDYDLLGAKSWADDISGYGNDINSAALDKDNRLILGGNVEDGSSDLSVEAISVSRFHSDGNPDDTFVAHPQGSEQFYHQVVVDDQEINDNQTQSVPRYGIIAVRPDGKTVVLSRDDAIESSNHSPRLTLLNATKNADTSKVTVDLSKSAPSFAIPNVGYRNMRALPDNSLLIAGATISGSTQTPAIIKLKPDLSVDTSFGTNGILTIGSAGKNQSAGDLEQNADGSIYAISSNADSSSGDTIRTGDITVTRIFPDDKPIVTATLAIPMENIERITVLIRGPHPIDPTSLGDNDLVLRGNGQIKKLRLLHVMPANDGSIIAMYRISSNLLSAGTYSITTVAGQILDNQGNGNARATLGELMI